MPWQDPTAPEVRKVDESAGDSDAASSSSNGPRKLSRVKVALVVLGTLLLLPIAILILVAVLLLLLAIKLITGELALARRWALGLWKWGMGKLTGDGRHNVRVRSGPGPDDRW